jgi:ubiquitin C-terminal hydrolase
VKQCYNPKIFCHAFKDWDGKPINVLEQMDVDEFFSLFLDKLEVATKGTAQVATIKNHFGGVFANQLLCKDCPHSSVRDEPFLALNLQVKNKKSLQQCLESFVEVRCCREITRITVKSATKRLRH